MQSPNEVEKANDSDSEAPTYQNSYCLESNNSFKIDPVDRIIKMVMINNLEDIAYDSTQCPKICNSVAADIRKRVKKLRFDRYKLVVSVTIIEKTSQSLETAMGFLWDAEKDNYSTFACEFRTFHAYCFIFGLYYE
ncbi:hypothetical protein KM043_011747 [Ampulex compressa]|nr:hypothetical protein KM043_011747 [Ampulex compressa]